MEILNSDAVAYGGGGIGNAGGMEAEPVSCHGYGWSLPLTLPPLAVLVFHSKKRLDPDLDTAGEGN
jgi:1,4-alpha-glucan branching enzyme